MTNAQLAPLTQSDKKILDDIIIDIHDDTHNVDDLLRVVDVIVCATLNNKVDGNVTALITTLTHLSIEFEKLKEQVIKLDCYRADDYQADCAPITKSNAANVDKLRKVAAEA